VFAEVPVKVTWISEQHLMYTVGVVEAMVKGLVLEALALEIARTANHWIAVVSGTAAELLSSIWAVPIGEPGNSRMKKIYNPYKSSGGLIRDRRKNHGIC
jgi:hypothetical protein